MIAILGAMQEEVRAIAAAVEGGEGGEGGRSVQAGPMRVETGRLAGRAIAVGFSGWGKVASASNTVRLVQACRTVWGHGPEALLFVGVAGALDDRLAVGPFSQGQAAESSVARCKTRSQGAGSVPCSR